MNATTFLKRVSYTLRGTDDDAPTAGTDDADYWFETLNLKKDEFFQDVTKEWAYSHISDITNTKIQLGTIAVATAPSFPLDISFLGASGYVYVIDTDGQRHDFEVIQPADQNTSQQQVYIDDQNPQQLHFTKPIAADDAIVGGTLYCPGFYMPDDLAYTANGFDPDTATIPLPNANWGVLAVASEIAFNDITYEDKAPDLNNKANNLYTLLVKRNRRGTAKTPRRVRNDYGTANGRKIRGY